ncbi:DUF3237 domain-containing protein [Steroidobacter agaridevorans]|uniref:DUF3237 domain-containing protein n=1 Tax=Steroidobacter agaridevorans TaxID=2695856 RepID=UPI00132618BD|nr:DUF3237 domain-containing protein [Steroidobacter agaridevorans]GFE85662.1 UPF0311 protein [Steroidobacter agaridevorans]
MPTRRELMGAAALLAVQGDALAAIAPAGEVRTRFAFEAHVTVDAPHVIGPSAHGLRRIVPIRGGEVTGPLLQGKVVPGGADWQFVRPDGVLQIEAKYTLQAADGALIMVTNRGLRHGPPDVIDRLARGEAVDPSLYYFRTSAEFEAPLDSKHAWLNRALFIGVAQRTAAAAIIKFHELL